MAAAPLYHVPDETWRVGRWVCSSVVGGGRRECGATVAFGEEHLPCDVCRGLGRRWVDDERTVSRWAPPIEFQYLSSREYGPELPLAWQERILDELAEDWAAATSSFEEARCR